MSRVGSKDWIPNTLYDVDDFCVVNDDIEYRCTIAHDSGATFIDTNRELRVGQGAIALNGGNAITIDGSNNIDLGGDLDSNAIILGANSYSFEVYDTNNIYFDSYGGTPNGGWMEITPFNVGIFFDDGSNNKGFDLNVGKFEVQDDNGLKGMEYKADYSAVGETDPLRIPHWSSVTGAISDITLNSGNAITIDASNNIDMGGSMDENIVIDGVGSKIIEFNLHDDATWTKGATLVQRELGIAIDSWDDSTTGVGTQFISQSIGPGIAVAAIGAYQGTNHMKINMTTTQKMFVQDDIFSKGFEYLNDYSAVGELDPLWIPHWSSVTNATLTSQTTAPIITTGAAATTLTAIHGTVLADATLNNIVITLPAASSFIGKVYTIKRIDSSVNTLTITRTGTDTIDGEISQELTAQRSALTFHSNGSDWFII